MYFILESVFMVTWIVIIKSKGISFRQMLLGLPLHSERFFVFFVGLFALIIWMQPYKLFFHGYPNNGVILQAAQ